VPPDLATRLATGGSTLSAAKVAQSRAVKFPVLGIGITSGAPGAASLVLRPDGSLGIAGRSAPFVDYVLKARRRIAEIRNEDSPWADATCMHPPTASVSGGAEVAAIAVFSNFSLNPPPAAVAIFPREDGGLRIQSVGAERAVVVEISASGDVFGGEYAGDDVYHSETMHTALDAARFIRNSTR
jgi:hypothetical protein